MNILLSYPKSGSHWIREVLELSGMSTTPMHKIALHKIWPPSKGDKLILLLRDYKECIPSMLYPNKQLTESIINYIFTETGSRAAIDYIENIVLYHIYPFEKYLLYYEDLILNGPFTIKKTFNLIPDFNWSERAEICKIKYRDKILSNHIHYHKSRIKDIELFDNLMEKLNPIMFHTYLKQYK